MSFFGHPKNIFQVFSFQLYFTKKNVEIVIIDFITHLIFQNALEDKNADRREKQQGKKSLKRKKKLSMKVFSLI